MSKPNEKRDIYYIPPNFLASGRLFGGMIRARNAIEACVLVLLTGIPIIKLPMSLTVRIIILCLLPLPLGIFGIIGFEGDSLSEFAINWVRWFIHRRNLYRSDVTIPETARKQKKRIWEQEATKPPEQLGIRIKQPRKKRKRPTKTEKQLNKNNRKMVPSHKKQVTYSEDFVPVKDIRNGIIETEDGRYIKVLEVEPINFLLRSTSEQKNIVASFASWMKISPIKIQIKVLTKKADIGKHLSTIERDMESESKTVEKNGRTLSLSNVTWSVESTALVGDELVPATYSAVATYSGPASSTVATGYITTAEYKGTVVSSGISSILYTVTYLGTKIEPTKAEPTFKGAVLVISIIGGTALLAALLFLGLTLRKNTTVYKATGKGNEYEKCGQLHLKAKNPELRIDRLKDIPEGVIAIEVDQAVAKKLFGQTIAIHCYDNTVEHTVGTVNGQYWFKVDIGTQEGEPDTEEEPV